MAPKKSSDVLTVEDINRLDLSGVTNASKILVIYTGGTIGMKTNPDKVYVPEPNYLEYQLRSLPMFHDNDFAKQIDLKVTDDRKYPLVMPLSSQDKRIIYFISEYDPLLDSCNMTKNEWSRIADDIKQFYKVVDGFVVLHGTDTMAYTASILSFMFEALGKPVILTGSQIPIFEILSDGRDNMLGALHIAGHFCIPEVSLFFDNKLFRGNCSTKTNTSEFDAFASPNLLPLVKMGVEVQVFWDNVFIDTSSHDFTYFDNLCSEVGILRLFPNVTSKTLEAFFRPPMKGVVLQTYGAGNCATSPEILSVFKDAVERGVILINISQCPHGAVNTYYETGKVLKDAGILNGADMTPEAALSKLSYVLGKDWDMKKKFRILETCIRGELRPLSAMKQSKHPEDVKHLIEIPLVESLQRAMRLRDHKRRPCSAEEVSLLKDAIFPSLLCNAASRGDLNMIKRIKENGGSLALSDYNSSTPLHIASAMGHYDVVEYLLLMGSLVHARDRFGRSALVDAVIGRHYKIIRLLRKNGAHLHLNTYRIAFELCHQAAIGDVVSLKAWYLAGADVNVTDYDGNTALHVAVSCKQKEALRFLLKCGADPDKENSSGQTPLQLAYIKGYRELQAIFNSHVSKVKQERKSSTSHVPADGYKYLEDCNFSDDPFKPIATNLELSIGSYLQRLEKNTVDGVTNEDESDEKVKRDKNTTSPSSECMNDIANDVGNISDGNDDTAIDDIQREASVSSISTMKNEENYSKGDITINVPKKLHDRLCAVDDTVRTRRASSMEILKITNNSNDIDRKNSDSTNSGDTESVTGSMEKIDFASHLVKKSQISPDIKYLDTNLYDGMYPEILANVSGSTIPGGGQIKSLCLDWDSASDEESELAAISAQKELYMVKQFDSRVSPRLFVQSRDVEITSSAPSLNELKPEKTKKIENKNEKI